MTTKTRIEITAQDKTKGAFGSVDKSLLALGGSVSKVAGLVTGLGAGFTAIGAANAIKGIIDTNDQLAKMAQQTGVAVESLAGLEFASSQSGTSLERTAKGVRAFSKVVLESSDETSRYAKLIKALGLDLEELKNSSPEEQFIKLAGALKNNVQEQERAAVVTSLLGDRYAELIPLLNQGEDGLRGLIERGKELNPVTAESAKKSEEFNDNLDQLSRSFTALKVEAASSILPTLNSITGEMIEATKQSGLLVGGMKGLQVAFKEFAESDWFLDLVGKSGPLGWLLKQRVEANKAKIEIEELGEQAEETAEKMQGIVIPGIKPSTQSFAKILNEIENESDDATASTKRLSTALSAEEREAEKVKNEIKQLTLAYDPLIKRNQELAHVTALVGQGLRQDIADREYKRIIEEFTEATDGANKSLKDLDKTTDNYGETGQRVFESTSEFAIQAARSIQTAMADALLQGVNSFQDFADSALNIVKRLAANIASVKILEGLGVGGLLGIGSSAAFGAGGSSLGVANGASLLSSGANLLSSGFGLTNLIGSGISSAGSFLGSSTLTAFGGGFSGGSAAGVSSALLNGGATSAASASGAAGLGATAAAIAGPAAIAFAASSIARAIAGDKRISGGFGDALNKIGDLPVIKQFNVLVPALNALFGRGPLKQKDSLIRGNVTDEGIADNFLTATNFKAKGGLLRGDKVDRVIINANTGELINGAPGLPESGISKELLPFADEAAEQAIQIGQLFDQAVKGFDASLRQTGETLGIGSDQLDNFQRWIQLTADSAEGVTGEQIAAEIQNIGDHMANVLLPGLQDMRRGNETATDALQRIVSETLALENALVVLGVSSADAQAAIKDLSISARTDLVDAAGGLEPLTQKVGFFAANFLTLEEQTELLFNSVDKELNKLGFSANLTRQEFADLVKSVTQVGGVTAETAISLLNLAPAFLEYKNAQDQLAAQSIDTAGDVDNLTNSVGDLGNEANNVAATVQASFDRIDTARENLRSAQSDLDILNARNTLTEAQNRLSEAGRNLSIAESNFDASVAEAQRQEQQKQVDAINSVIEERNTLISTYENEASALSGVVDRFSAFSDRLLDFKDSLALGNLSPFSPSEQLAIARQQLEQARAGAAAGDEQAFNKLPSAVEAFISASLQANGATDSFREDFNFGQSVLNESASFAQSVSDSAADQLRGLETQIEELKRANILAESSIEELTNIKSGVLSVGEAARQLFEARVDHNEALAEERRANNALETIMSDNGVAIDGVEEATNEVEKRVRELAEAVLQGFGNAAISDKQIVDFVLANQNQSDSFFAAKAVEYGLSGNQLERALSPLGVSRERINAATEGAAVRGQDISSAVDFLLASGDFMGIYKLAKANGVSSQQLADNSVLSKEEIDNFVRANNLQPFEVGTDFVKRDGIAMLHKGEAVVPSSTTDEIKSLRQEFATFISEQAQNTDALIRAIVQSAKDNAAAIADSNERIAALNPWKNRVQPRVA